MTNEIKEILEMLQKYGSTNDKVLLDYITNLQEENKEWERIFDTFSRRPYAHRYLEEKRKELNNDNIIGLDSESIYKDYYNLQERIDKANSILNKLVVMKPWENADNPMRKIYRPIKNTTKQQVYRAIIELEDTLQGDE